MTGTFLFLFIWFLSNIHLTDLMNMISQHPTMQQTSPPTPVHYQNQSKWLPKSCCSWPKWMMNIVWAAGEYFFYVFIFINQMCSSSIMLYNLSTLTYYLISEPWMVKHQWCDWAQTIRLPTSHVHVSFFFHVFIFINWIFSFSINLSCTTLIPEPQMAMYQ